MQYAGGRGGVVVAMVIRGSLPTDATPLSVDTNTVDRWMRTRSSWTCAYGEPGFEVIDVRRKAGMKAVLTTGTPATVESRAALETSIAEWLDATSFMDNAGGAVFASTGARKTVITKTGLTTELKSFGIESTPARDQLLSILVRFHATVTPLVRVELGFTGG